jgi:uncharacterized protein YjiS (DUF1127 family)
MSTTRHQDPAFIFSAANHETERTETMHLIARAREEQAEALGVMLRQAGIAAAGFIGRWLVMPVVGWFQREQLRLQLSGMDDRLLADIGLQRGDIRALVNNAHTRVVSATVSPAASATLHHLPTGRKSDAPDTIDTDRHPLAA